MSQAEGPPESGRGRPALNRTTSNTSPPSKSDTSSVGVATPSCWDGGVTVPAHPDCVRCRYAGLIFPDGRRCCYYHATEADERLVDELDARAPGIGLVRDGRGDWGCTFGWPYGPNLYMATRQRLLEWAEPLGLRRSLRGHACRAWLTTGRRCYGACRTDDQVAGWPVAPGTASDLNPMPLSWPDHISTWTRDGEPAVIVAQPYHLDDVDYAHLGVIAADPAVRLEALPPGRSWYGARTYFLAVWRA